MDIQHIGHSSFRLRYKKVYTITDPFDPDKVGLDFPKKKADIVTISHDHDDHNDISNIDGMKKVISGPGEYEVSGVSILGFPSYHDDKKGKERGKNTIYVFEMGLIRLAHLGDLGHELEDTTVQMMGDIDVLMIPVGGKYTIDSNQAAKVVQSIEPVIVIPMHFKHKGLNQKVFGELEEVEEFTNELGIPVEETKKLKLKKSTVGEDQRVVIFKNK